jgi:hypothetical protein
MSFRRFRKVEGDFFIFTIPQVKALVLERPCSKCEPRLLEQRVVCVCVDADPLQPFCTTLVDDRRTGPIDDSLGDNTCTLPVKVFLRLMRY